VRYSALEAEADVLDGDGDREGPRTPEAVGSGGTSGRTTPC
jgi:hypothetical protein